jgi:folate-binding protein YgfZ
MDYLASTEALARYVAEIEAFGIRPDTTRSINLWRIGSGIPSIPSDAGPGDLPQEAGLECDAVSFTKGCFLGQEVMARLKSMGHANRALWFVQMKHGLKMPTGTEPVPLYAGEVVAGELRSRAGAIGLAMLKKRAIAGREWLSLTPGGEDVISLRAEECARDLTLPPTSPG